MSGCRQRPLKPYRLARRRANTTHYELLGPDRSYSIEVAKSGDLFRLSIDGKTSLLKLSQTDDPGVLVAQFGDKLVTVTLEEADERTVILRIGGERLTFRRPLRTAGPAPPQPTLIAAPKDTLASPLPGKVISIAPKEGERVKAGDSIVVIESMKMETVIRSDRDATIERILVSEGSSVKRGQALVKFGP